MFGLIIPLSFYQFKFFVVVNKIKNKETNWNNITIEADTLFCPGTYCIEALPDEVKGHRNTGSMYRFY